MLLQKRSRYDEEDLKRSRHDPPRFVDFLGSQRNRHLVRWGYNGAIKYMSKQGKYIGQRYMYYSNTTATNRCLLFRSGDINPNPGPTPCEPHSTSPHHSSGRQLCYDVSTLHKLQPSSKCHYGLCKETYGLQLTLLVLPANAKPIEADLTRNFISSIQPRIFVRLRMYYLSKHA